MNFDTFRLSNKYTLHFIAFCLIAICSIQNEIFEFSRFVISILCFGALVLNLKIGKATISDKNLNLTIFLLLIFCIIISIFPIKSDNPYSVFQIQFVKSIILIAITAWVYWTNEDIKRQENFIALVPYIFLLLANCYYIIFDFSPINPNDQSRHCANSFLIYDLIFSENPSKLISSLFYFDFYQPLVYLVSVPFLFVFGKSYTAATLSIPIVWLTVGYMCTFKYFKHILRIGISYSTIITFIIWGSVISSSLCKTLMLDLPCLTMVAVFSYTLARSGYLKNTKYVFYVGIVFGLGTITKSNFLILALVPVTFSVLRLFHKAYKGTIKFNQLIINFIIFVTGIFLGGGFWYLINNNHFNYNLEIVTTAMGKVEGDPNPKTWLSFIYYPKYFLYYFTPTICVCLLIGCIINLKKYKNHFFTNAVACASLITMYIICTMTWNKDGRTFLPALFYVYPAIIGLTYIKNKTIHISVFSLLIFITFLTNISFVTGDPFKISRLVSDPPYSLSNSPLLPSTKNANEAHYIYNFLYKRTLGNNSNQPQLQINTNLTSFSDKMYESKFNSTKSSVVPLKDFEISFWRDYYWPDYYLFAFKTDINNLYIKKIDESKVIGGDIKIILFDGVLNQKFYFLPSDTLTLKIPIDINANHVSFALNIDHTHSSGQLAAFTLKFMGDKNYTGWGVPLYTYSTANEQQVCILDKPSAK